MKILFAFLPAILTFWPLLKVLQKGWRLFVVLLFVALATGCTSTSNKFDKSPCACAFQNLNTSYFGSKADA
ncbi:hypothetical protein AWB79_05022 [Caballeronia hypogeia]|uniref:Uncharacterized protein n=1 Tax=Caballeronia hypogeia TaxID=1777140 RepID=A0A158CAE4_9BURK|nr:hypothetical protein AWB79_05022 [Caballeronia hypogeia]